MTAGLGSYGAANAVFFGLCVLLCLGRISRHWAIAGLIAVSFLWAAAGLWLAWTPGGSASIYGALDLARATALLFLLNDALRRLSGEPGDKPLSERMGVLAPAAALMAIGLASLRLLDMENALFFGLIGHVAIAVLGLLLVENLLQASRPNALWTTKHLLIGTGAIFAFDLYYYTEALLLLRIDQTVQNAQPIIAVLAMPLILISARRLNDIRIRLPVSRSLIVSTTALLASGVYILGVAGIAYLILGLGWEWGPTLQLILLVGAAMVLLTLLSSTSLRHGGRRFIERNLFTFAYDYRREWLRLVASMASADDEITLDRRALEATANLLDADRGVLFLRTNHGDLQRPSNWRFQSSWPESADSGGRRPAVPPKALIAALSLKQTAIVFDQTESMPDGLKDDAEVKDWLAGFREPWVLLGLFAHQDLIGVMVIARPRMRRRLTFEDFDLLEIFSHQLGSYLTVEELARQVAEAEHFDRMSKHVTFVAHDLKNLISQLSLVLQQARRHAHNPAFVSDAFLTIGDAVERMTLLMRRVQEGARTTPPTAVDLASMLQDAERRHRCGKIAAPAAPVIVRAEPTALSGLLDHLIDNAREAAGDGGEVALTLERKADMAHLDIRDNGPGMTQSFIDDELFKPFASTKTTGFGIGMYQCRDWIQRWGGQLTVESESGRGTVVTMALPLAPETRRNGGGSGRGNGADGSHPAARKARDAVEEHAA